MLILRNALARGAATVALALALVAAGPLARGPVPAAAQADGPAEEGSECGLSLAAESAAAAMVVLTLDAPCHPGERVELHHEGMVFSAVTDADGALSVTVPALAEYAIFVAIFPDGAGTSADVEVSSLAFYDRSVVQWQGPAGLELHAFEYGAGYDDPGHVWPGAPRDIAVAATGQGGFLTTLGAPSGPDARTAQVYSFPVGIARRDGEVALSVEAEVTEANCGRPVSAQVLHVAEGVFVTFHDVDVTMPGCEAVGDFLLLKTLLDDLTIATR